MIGTYLLPLLRPVWGKLYGFADSYGVTPLSYRIALTLTFLSAPVFMAVQMPVAGLISFLLHLLIWAMHRFKHESLPVADSLHLYSLCGTVVLAGAFGVAGNYGMPVAFLFLSWMVLGYVRLLRPHHFHLIGMFEVGLSVVAMTLAPVYIPAIAILFGLACLVSCGITSMANLKSH